MNQILKIKVTMLVGILIVIVVLILGFIFFDKAKSSRVNQSDGQTEKTTQTVSQLPSPTGGPKVICKRFTDIDQAIQNIDTACDLDLSGQGLSELPPTILMLKNLTSINLGNNNFNSFPDELTSMSKLMEIDLNDNQIKSLPASISKLTSLQKLDLSNNPVSALPNEISKLKYLSYLTLKGNNISEDQKTKIKGMFVRPTGTPEINIDF